MVNGLALDYLRISSVLCSPLSRLSLPVLSLPKTLRKVYTTNPTGAKEAFSAAERVGFWEKMQ
jgi:hypothetical protein